VPSLAVLVSTVLVLSCIAFMTMNIRSKVKVMVRVK